MSSSEKSPSDAEQLDRIVFDLIAHNARSTDMEGVSEAYDRAIKLNPDMAPWALFMSAVRHATTATRGLALVMNRDVDEVIAVLRENLEDDHAGDQSGPAGS